MKITGLLAKQSYLRGGPGVEQAAAYINSEFARVFNKLNYGFRITIQNLYMVSENTPHTPNMGVVNESSYSEAQTGAISGIPVATLRTTLGRESLKIGLLIAKNTAR